MDAEVGNRDFPLWLIGDSNPPQWESRLLTPLDPRHPVRHNIWTPILDVIQDRVYRKSRLRVDTSTLYIRNAVVDPATKPTPAGRQWGASAQSALSGLGKLIQTHKPALLFCFGAFVFEFVRRAGGEGEQHNYGHWSAISLGDEFRRRIKVFDPARTNFIPLLHRVVSGGKFIESQEHFCGQKGANYFEVVGGTLAATLLQHRDQLPIWIA